MMTNTILLLLVGGMVWSLATASFGIFVHGIWRKGERRLADWVVALAFISAGVTIFILCLWKFTVVMEML